MNPHEQYQEILRLKCEINTRLSKGTDPSSIKELAIFLAQDREYQALYRTDNQLIKLSHFLTVWREEQERMPLHTISDGIFYQINSLNELEQKYYRIEYYGLRIENQIPQIYCDQLLDWLLEHKVSGIALGIIIRNRTEKGMENLLIIAQELKRRNELPNAVLLLQYAREKYPDHEELLLEEADCWLQVMQWQKALELLQKLDNPTTEILEIISELQQVTKNG